MTWEPFNHNILPPSGFYWFRRKYDGKVVPVLIYGGCMYDGNSSSHPCIWAGETMAIPDSPPTQNR